MSSLALSFPGGPEWIIIALIALLFFGKRLPEVGRAVGKSIVEFKKGVKGIADEIEEESNKSDRPLEPYDKRLGGNEEDLRKLQKEGAAHREAESTPASQPRPETT